MPPARAAGLCLTPFLCVVHAKRVYRNPEQDGPNAVHLATPGQATAEGSCEEQLPMCKDTTNNPRQLEEH